MKKKQNMQKLMGLLVLTALVITGSVCKQKQSNIEETKQANIDEAKQEVQQDDDDDIKAVVIKTNDSDSPPPLLDSDWEYHNTLSLQKICNAYLKQDTSYQRFWQEKQDGWILVELLDGGSKAICPKAVYPQSLWSPEEILECYRVHPELWAKSYNGYSFHLWSKDYLTEFVVTGDDGWLTINDVKVFPMAIETHDLRPQKLIQAYQSGEWDGETKWYSEKYDTHATINRSLGIIKYEYATTTYTSEQDPDGIAYSDYAEEPVFESYDDSRIYNHGQIDYQSEHIIMAHTNYVVDFPEGQLKGLIDESRIEGEGTYALTKQGIALYERGELIKSWPCKASKNGRIAPEMQLAFLGDKVVHFAEDGNTVEIMQDVIDCYYNREKFVVFSLRDGILTLGNYDQNLPNNWREVKIADEVESASLDFPLIFKKTNGNAYAIDSEFDVLKDTDGNRCMIGSDLDLFLETEPYKRGQFESSLLGSHSAEHYRKLYGQCGYDMDKLYQAAKIERGE